MFSQQVNIVYEFQKTCFWSCLLEIAFRKTNLAYRYSPLLLSLQNVLFLGSVALMQWAAAHWPIVKRIVAVCGLPELYYNNNNKKKKKKNKNNSNSNISNITAKSYVRLRWYYESGEALAAVRQRPWPSPAAGSSGNIQMCHPPP